MCQPAPGPRCASHTKKRVRSLSNTLSANRTRLEKLTTDADHIAADGGEVPAALNRRILSAIARDKKLREDLRLAVREYDATLTGRRELEAKIEATSSPALRRRLEKRHTQAKMLAAWRKNALQRSNQETRFSPRLSAGEGTQKVSV